MLIRSLRPGPVIEDSVEMDCRGCGRRMRVGGLQMKNKVRCKECGRIHKLTEKQLEFRYTEKVRKREQATIRFGASVVVIMSLVAVTPMAYKCGAILLSEASLSFLGLSAFWIALFVYALCYGAGAVVGISLGAAMILIRKKTQDLGILGALMTIFGGFGRVVYYAVGKQVGVPFSQTFPYELILGGLIGTSGSLWRARVFPHR